MRFIKRLGENVVDYLGQKCWLEEGFGNRYNRFQTRAEKKKNSVGVCFESGLNKGNIDRYLMRLCRSLFFRSAEKMNQ